MKNNLLKIFFLIVIIASFSGCILVPFINAFKSMGGTKADRIELLDKSLKKYFDLYSMQLLTELSSLIVEDFRPEFANRFRKNKEVEKVVDFSIELVNFDEAAKSATVQVQAKYFRVPYYVVQKRIEKQEWVFSRSNSWQIKSINYEQTR